MKMISWINKVIGKFYKCLKKKQPLKAKKEIVLGGEGTKQQKKERVGEEGKRKESQLPPVYSQGTDIVLSLGSPLVVMYILSVLVRVLQRGEQGAYIKRDNIPYNKNKKNQLT